MAGHTKTMYDPEMCSRVIEYMVDGASFANFCASEGISQSTFYLWRKKYPEFNDACEVADMHCTVWWEERARECAHKDGSRGNSSIILAALYNRGNRFWTNKQEIETTTVNKDELDLSQLTDEELELYERVAAIKERVSNREK